MSYFGSSNPGRSRGDTLMLCAAFAASVLMSMTPAADASVLYGAGIGEPEVLYRLDTGAQTATPVCDVGALAPGNQSSPNGLGYDAINDRLYFSINTATGDGTPSDLYFCDLDTGLVVAAGSLVGQAAGATFDQSTGQYLYIRNRTDDLAAVTLDAGGVKTGEAVLAGDFSADAVLFRGGDLAVDCNGVVFGSSLGTGGGTKAFFSIDLAGGNAFTMIHLDPAGNNADTGFATAKQLSFGQDGTLFSQTGGTYWTVDPNDGSQSAALEIPDGTPISMSDLASGLECATCTTDLIAGGGSPASAVDVGEVTVETTGDGTWDVTYETTGGWEMTEIHLDVACDVADVPQTKTGNPKVGHFCFKDYPPPGTQSYTVPGIGPEECHGDDCDCVVFAAHAVVVDTDSCSGAVVYGTERFTGDLYELDLATMTATFVSGTGPFSPDDQNQPNGAAYDAAKGRLYYSAQGVEGSTPSDLFFYDFVAASETSAGDLAGFDVGGSFYAGSYYYIPNGTDDLRAVSLAGDGTVASETVALGDFTGTAKVYRFGDIAISSKGILYGSTNGTSGSSAEFFSIDLGSGTYTRICGDEKAIPDCVHSLQLAFGSDGSLYAHSAGTGSFYLVDVTTGAGSDLGTVTGSTEGLFTDLASGELCYPRVETAWGEGPEFPGKSWAMYFECGDCD